MGLRLMVYERRRVQGHRVGKRHTDVQSSLDLVVDRIGLGYGPGGWVNDVYRYAHAHSFSQFRRCMAHGVSSAVRRNL